MGKLWLDWGYWQGVGNLKEWENLSGKIFGDMMAGGKLKGKGEKNKRQKSQVI